MNPSTTPQPERLLSIDDVAAMIGLAPGTLRNWRVTGRGPRSVKVGALVRYRPSDVAAWQAAQDDPVNARQERVSAATTRKAVRR